MRPAINWNNYKIEPSRNPWNDSILKIKQADKTPKK